MATTLPVKVWRIFRVLGRSIFGLLTAVLSLFVIVVVLLQLPSTQNWLVKQVAQYFENETQRELSVDNLYLNFDGSLSIKGLYIADVDHDTLVYSEALQLKVRVLPLFFQKIHVNFITWEGLHARIHQDVDSSFNFQYILDAFVPEAPKEVVDSMVPPGKPWLFQLDYLRFNNFDLAYTDLLVGMDAHLLFGALELKPGILDIVTQTYDVNALYLKDAAIRFHQESEFINSVPEDTISAPIPLFSIADLTLENIVFDVVLPNGTIDAKGKLGKLNFSLPQGKTNINNFIVETGPLQISDVVADVVYKSTPATDSLAMTALTTTPKEAFSWPDWRVVVPSISIENTQFSWVESTESYASGVFNEKAIGLTDVNIRLREVVLDNRFQMAIDEIRFTEASGFTVNRFEGAVALDNSSLSVTSKLLTPYTAFDLSATTSFSVIDSLFEGAKELKWQVNLAVPNFGLQDAFFFSPDLRSDTLWNTLAKTVPAFYFSANGDKEKISVENVSVNWGDMTKIVSSGVISNPYDSTRTALEAFAFSITTNKTDYQSFLPVEDIAIPLPDTLFLQVLASGSLADLKGDMQVYTDLGTAALSANAAIFSAIPTYQAKLQLNTIRLAQLTGDKRFDDLDLALEIDGKGNDLETLFASYKLEIQSICYNDYTYENFLLNGTIANKQMKNRADYSDINLDFSFDSQMTLLTEGPVGDFHLDLSGANFTGLRLSDADLRAGGELFGRFNFMNEQQEVELRASNFRVVKNREVFPLSKVLLYAFSDAQGSRVKIDSEILKLDGNSNMTFEQMPTVLSNHFLSYYDTEIADSLLTPYYLNIDGEITNSRFLSEVLVPGLTELEPGELHIHYSNVKQLFDADIQLPLINYAGTRIANLKLTLDSKVDSLGMRLNFDRIETGPILIPTTQFTANVREDQLAFLLQIDDFDNKRLLNLGLSLVNQNDTQYVHLDPEALLLNYENWSIHPDNLIWMANKEFGAKNFKLSHQNQYVELVDSSNEKTNLHVSFNNFTLGTLFKILHPEDEIINGYINGNLNLAKPSGTLGFLADLTVSDIMVLDVPTGDLHLKSNNLTKDTYTIDLGLGGEGLELQLAGKYRATTMNPSFDLLLEIEKAEMRVLESFSNGLLSDAKGHMTGNVKLGGLLSNWEYSGALAFEDAGFFVKALNTKFELSNERIDVAQQKVVFNNFTLRDANGNTSRLTGEVGLFTPTNPDVSLRLVSSNFLFLNTTREHNDLFFGKLLLDMDVQLSGTALQPVINASTRLNKGTSLHFIVPESELAEIERDGVVFFTNVRNPDDPFTTFRGSGSTSQVFGLDLRALIEVDKATTFRVVMDERSGDFLSVAGGANLIFDLAPTGRMGLSGQYEINEGRYELSFYDLVRRRFDFRKGSTITWSGNPLAGTLDLSAIYNVRTSARDLMAAQITGADASTQNRYRQELPFEVFLNIKGEMLQPEISFALDMPQNSRGELGGNVYATIMQLNENESELNKQVFALLVLGGFIPEMGGSSGGASTSMVRSSVSQLLSDQLNTLSGKYIKGVDIDLGLDSFTDYRTGDGQDRTQLNVNVSKQLLDDRLIVSVGSNLDLEGDRAQQQQASDIIGNISLEYLLTEDGRYRFKAFRRNQFEGVFDGQIITTGVSLRYSREFNRFRQIWRSQRNEEAIEQETPTIESDEE